MYVYLTADADEKYDSSAYAYIVANFPVNADKRLGWTVVESYLHGLLDLSNFIIKKKVYQRVREFVICTPSALVIKVMSTDYLEKLSNNSWKPLEGSYLFHGPILRELYYHYLFYKEREVKWTALTEVGEQEYRQYERCVDAVKQLLE